MLGRHLSQNVIDSYKKQKPFLPMFLAIMSVVLVVLGIIIIVMGFSGGGGKKIKLFSKEPTATSTMPPTPVMSPTPTFAPTESPTPTVTISPTPSGPTEYEVQNGDTCYGIADKFKVDLTALLAINNFENGECPIYAGEKIKVPAPGQTLPTGTPVPASVQAGTKITYQVLSGDSLGSIANKFNTTVDDIIAQNPDKLSKNNSSISVGQQLTVRVNIITPTPTYAPTSTLAS
jgi:LysM repeat protein